MKHVTGNESDGAIVCLDVQGFNRAERTDDDRVAIRKHLQEIARDLLGDLGVPGEVNDTGDGLLCVLPPGVARHQLLARFFPDLESRLREHNRTQSYGRQIRIRMVFSQGSARRDLTALTGPGIVGSAVNHASRLLDSRQLREDLAAATGRSVSLMVSHAYYTGTIARENPLLVPAFRRVLVKAKDGVLEAWLFRPAYRYEPGPARPATRDVTLHDLPPHLFVSTADVHVYDLYRRTVGQVPLAAQLASALLLSEGAIVHCADPYRRDEVRAELERFGDFVENGEIVFLLGSTIADVGRDYRRYLEHAAHDEPDAGMLEGPPRETGALRRAAELVASSPFRVRRGYSGTHHFRRAVREDLRPAEEIVSSVRPVRKLRTVNLTLYQLLTLSYVSGGQVCRFIADDEMIEAFLEKLDRLMQQQFISRQIILTALREHFGEQLAEHGSLRSSLEARIHSLYMSATTFPHTHIEVTPRRDEQSPYHYGHLRTHLQLLAGDPTISDLPPVLVRELRDSPEWPGFARHHLHCVAELAALRLADWSVDPGRIFARHLAEQPFPAVREILRGHPEQDHSGGARAVG